MILETGGEAKFHLRLVEGVSLPNGVEPDVLLVDGQQRLTSPFQATTCGRVVSTMNIRKQPVKRWFYFDMRRALARAFFSPIESSGDSRIGVVLIHAFCRRRKLACMARSLSVDLRRRVVGAIEGGLSCRAAAQRFGVSAHSTAKP
jgi:hypothetical protein